MEKSSIEQKKHISISLLLSLFFAAIVPLAADGQSNLASVQIENNVSSFSNSGGNGRSESGSVEAGYASSSSSVRVEVNDGGGEKKIETSAKASADGQTVELKEDVEAEAGKDISIHKQEKSGEGGSSAQVEIELLADEQERSGQERQDGQKEIFVNEDENSKKNDGTKTDGSLTALMNRISKLIQKFSSFLNG